MPLDYKELFEQIKAHLAGIRRTETNLEEALAKKVSEREALEATYNAIAPLVGEEPLPTVKSLRPNIQMDVLKAAGMSVAVRALIDAFPNENFTASVVRDRLAEQGWSWEKYINPQATVYTTLVRLAAGGAVKETIVDGKKAFYSSTREMIAPPPIMPIEVTGANKIAEAVGRLKGLGQVTVSGPLPLLDITKKK